MTDRLRQLLHRLRAMFQRAEQGRDLDKEVFAHLELAIEENLQRGLSSSEARRQALIDFGAQQAKERPREARCLPFLETLFQDVRLALRVPRKSPGFAAVAIPTLVTTRSVGMFKTV